MDRNTMRIACIIPAFDEEPTIERIASGARRYCDQVFVVDDGSSDRTAELSRKAEATVISHLIRLGTGGAISTGFCAALKTECEIILTMDGDGQHDPAEIPLVLEPILAQGADVVVGSRLLQKSEAMPIIKRIGNTSLSVVTSLISGTKITDSQSGFRAYRRRVLEFIMHSAWGYPWASEMLILAAKAGFEIKEAPITAIYTQERQRGTNVKDGLQILYSMLKSPNSRSP